MATAGPRRLRRLPLAALAVALPLDKTTTSGVGTLNDGHRVRYLLNYSAEPREVAAPVGRRELFGGASVAAGVPVWFAPWGVAILREAGPCRTEQ